MGRKLQVVCLTDDWEYEILTDRAVEMYQRARELDIFTLGSLIVLTSALEACNEDHVPKGLYPISGAILIDLMEEHEIPQWKLALSLGVDRNVIYRRILAEKKTRGIR